MRWLKKTSKTAASETVKCKEQEQGAAAVLVALSMVVLLGFSALAVDVGAMYAEKAQLQNGADATALAIAGDCAKGGNCATAMTAESNRLADDNANDGSSGVFSVTQPTATSVRVETNAQAVGSTADSFGLYFARVMGIDTAIIHARAEASWGAPSAATTLPWTISQCVFEKYLSPSQLAELNSTGSFTGDPMATHILLRYDENTPDFPGCPPQNGYAPGGFGWLDLDSGCSANINIANSEIGNEPGLNFPSACDGIIATIKDEPILLPIFDTATGTGQHATYGLVGFIAFQVTGYKFGGGPNVTSLDPAAPSCTGNCRGIQGFFTRYVSLEEGLSTSGGAPNYGASTVWLSE
ncbi:TadE/TadG family type IV pilus assembly protein [Pseudarthrobacter sp. NS4]|uniref:TadE/TadG family type IV pilus assembly protein n=1 Tax=Pseudarthrobacter sp. NS4 TaxID=2973976 RepID=UPI002161DA76|nr:TadE/TadG family type IV pilus assembly protein [Pseudarthrobacter sp. NS4]